MPFKFKYFFLKDIFFQIPFSENQLLREYFSWQSPNFQNNFLEQLTLLLFIVFSYFIKLKDRFVRIFSYLSLLAFFFYQPAIIILNIFVAVSGGSFFQQYLNPKLAKYSHAASLALILIFTLTFSLKNSFAGKVLPKLPKEIEEGLQADKAGGEICLFYNLNLEKYFDFSFANCILLNHEYRDYQQAFAEYKKIITLEDDWQLEVEKQGLNYLLAFEDEPIVGVFHNVLHWNEIKKIEGYDYSDRGVPKQSSLILLKKP